MDYNDFAMRLKRTLTSLNGRFNEDIAVYVTHGQDDEDSFFFIQAGNDDNETIINKLFIILYNLSSLKDNLKNCLKNKGINPQIVEDEINSSLHLQVLIDIINQEKHGYPLKKSNRSNKNPLIKHAKQSIVVMTSSSEPASSAGIFFNEKELNITGDTKTTLSAMIFDDKDNFLFRFDELAETCFEKFEQLAKKHNCY